MASTEVSSARVELLVGPDRTGRGGAGTLTGKRLDGAVGRLVTFLAP